MPCFLACIRFASFFLGRFYFSGHRIYSNRLTTFSLVTLIFLVVLIFLLVVHKQDHVITIKAIGLISSGRDGSVDENQGKREVCAHGGGGGVLPAAGQQRGSVDHGGEPDLAGDALRARLRDLHRGAGGGVEAGGRGGAQEGLQDQPAAVAPGPAVARELGAAPVPPEPGQAAGLGELLGGAPELPFARPAGPEGVLLAPAPADGRGAARTRGGGL